MTMPSGTHLSRFFKQLNSLELNLVVIYYHTVCQLPFLISMLMKFNIFCCRCNCGHCSAMPTSANSFCCRESEKVWKVVEEYPKPLKCITCHPGFYGNCLNEYVLQAAYSHFRQMHGRGERQPLHKYVQSSKISCNDYLLSNLILQISFFFGGGGGVRTPLL